MYTKNSQRALFLFSIVNSVFMNTCMNCKCLVLCGKKQVRKSYLAVRYVIVYNVTPVYTVASSDVETFIGSPLYEYKTGDRFDFVLILLPVNRFDSVLIGLLAKTLDSILTSAPFVFSNTNTPLKTISTTLEVKKH